MNEWEEIHLVSLMEKICFIMFGCVTYVPWSTVSAYLAHARDLGNEVFSAGKRFCVYQHFCQIHQRHHNNQEEKTALCPSDKFQALTSVFFFLSWPQQFLNCEPLPKSWEEIKLFTFKTNSEQPSMSRKCSLVHPIQVWVQSVKG